MPYERTGRGLLNPQNIDLIGIVLELKLKARDIGVGNVRMPEPRDRIGVLDRDSVVVHRNRNCVVIEGDLANEAAGAAWPERYPGLNRVRLRGR